MENELNKGGENDTDRWEERAFGRGKESQTNEESDRAWQKAWRKREGECEEQISSNEYNNNFGVPILMETI